MVVHVVYEHDMFFGGLRLLNCPADDLQKNVAIEVTLTHFRILRDFYCDNRGNPPKGDSSCGIVAKDYVPTFTKDESGVFSRDYKTRVDQLLDHLSTGRLTLDRNWQFNEQEERIRKCWRKFQSCINTSWKNEFDNYLQPGGGAAVKKLPSP
jgi:hypothetical protein